MTVSTTTSRADYTGNGVTTAFAVPFYFLDNSHLLVLRTQVSTGAITTLALGTDYTVSGAGVSGGGTVTAVVAPTNDQKISILRNVPLTQLTHYVENDPFPAASHERALDQLTMEMQQVGEVAGRALQLPANTPSSGVSTSLPYPSANKLIGWNESATGLQNVDSGTLATIVAFGTAKADIFNGDGVTTQFVLTANPGALNNLDVSISGVTQKPGIDYTWVSGTTITFTTAPPSGTSNVLVRYLQGLPQGYTDSAASTYTPDGTGAVTTTVQAHLRSNLKSITDFGALGAGADESAKANAMIAAHNYLYVPPNFTLVCKNIQLFDNTKVICEGTLKLPSACSDFDRLLYANNKSHIEIDVREIDGNYAGQSGNIGTHLIYIVAGISHQVKVKYIHDHYLSAGAPMPSVDGVRNVSSGGVFIYGVDYAKVDIGLFEGWGREAVYLQSCRWSEVTVGHIQGKYLTEYSGLQVSGSYNTVNRASVDFAGASAVGFDTQFGTLSNIVATNTRENSGVNFGHAGRPATGSVAENIVVDGTFGSGITVAASSHDVSINNFTVRNTGEVGISFSDGVLRGKLSNGVMAYPSRWGLVATGAEVQTSNLRSSDLDAATLLVTVTSGTFAAGETVTSVGGSASIRKAVQNLTGSQQRLFFTSNVPASYVVGNTITSSGGATGTISGVYVPTEYNEASGGQYLRDPRYFSGTGNQIRFPDGTAIYTWNVACVHTTAGTAQTFTQSFFSNVTWASAPYVVVSVGSVNNTNAFTVNRLSATATTSQIDILLNASVNQTYGIQVMAIGRWK